MVAQIKFCEKKKKHLIIDCDYNAQHVIWKSKVHLTRKLIKLGKERQMYNKEIRVKQKRLRENIAAAFNLPV